MSRSINEHLNTQYRTWVEIDTEAIKNNYRVFRSHIDKDTKLAVVVKSNAYGHDIVQFAHEMISCGADVLAVDSVVEALVLRREGIDMPILVLGYTLQGHVAGAVEKDICITVSSFEALRDIRKQKLDKKLLVHIKVDTGMHRQGFLFQDEERLLKELESMKDVIEVDGLYMHFAAAKDPDGPDETKGQIKIFEMWVEKFEKRGFTPTKHACATSGTLLYPNAHFDMVRIGIGMYGLWSSKEVEEYCGEKIILKPVLSWKTIITEVKQLKKGEKIGYDLTEELKRDSVVAICPIGYWHGYGRGFSSKGEVLVGGVSSKVLGRVSMDMIVIDVTDVIDVKKGDVVTLLGEDGNERISAEELAEILKTINYEVVTGINPRTKRIFL